MDRDLVRLCGSHRRELRSVETHEGEQLVCPAGRSHVPHDADGRPTWEVWLRTAAGLLVARVYTVRKGHAVPEDWYEDMSKNYAANLAGRDPDGFTEHAREARYAGRAGLVRRRPLTPEAREVAEKARQTQAAAEGRRRRLMEAVALLGLLIACVLGHPGEAWCQSHSGVERLDEREVVPFDALVPEEPPPSPSPTPDPNQHATEAVALFDAGTQFVTSAGQGEDRSDVQPYGSIELDSPLALWGKTAQLRGELSAGLTSAPGETSGSFNFSSVETFQSVNVGASLRRIVGSLAIGTQRIQTSLVCEGAFGFRLDTAGVEPASRTARSYGCGVDVRETGSRASARITYGRDDVVGERGWGQVMVRVRLPLPLTDKILALGVRASLGVGTDVNGRPLFRQFDYRAVTIAADLAQAIRSVRGLGAK